MGDFTALYGRLDPDNNLRGKQFEQICKRFLENDPYYRDTVRKVWHWDDWEHVPPGVTVNDHGLHSTNPGSSPGIQGKTMRALSAGVFAALVSLGMALTPAVAVADPSDSGPSSDGSSAGNSQSAGGGSPSGNEPGNAGGGDPAGPPTSKLGSDPTGPGDSGDGNPTGPPTSKLGSDPTAMTPDNKAKLADQLAKIDAEVAEVVTLRQQVDTDPGFEPGVVELVDSEADELISEQQLVHALAGEQGITVTPATTPAPVPAQFANMSLDQIMLQANTERQAMLDAQVRAQAAQIRATNDQVVALKAKLQDPNLSQGEKDAIRAEIDSLYSTSQLEMTQLQSTMNKLNQTSEGLSNWLSEDANSKNAITGNLR